MLAEVNVDLDIQRAVQVLLAVFELPSFQSAALQSFLSCLTLGDPETSHSCSPSRGEVETELEYQFSRRNSLQNGDNLQTPFRLTVKCSNCKKREATDMIRVEDGLKGSLFAVEPWQGKDQCRRKALVSNRQTGW